jgi:hypothetical protein
MVCYLRRHIQSSIELCRSDNGPSGQFDDNPCSSVGRVGTGQNSNRVIKLNHDLPVPLIAALSAIKGEISPTDLP